MSPTGGTAPDLFLVAQDNAFSRMLIMELEENGFEFLQREKMGEAELLHLCEEDVPFLLVFDADGGTIPTDRILSILSYHEVPVILYGYPDERVFSEDRIGFLESSDNRKVFLRPFLISSFLGTVRDFQRRAFRSQRTSDAPVQTGFPGNLADMLILRREDRTVQVGGDEIRLTESEFLLLSALLRQRGIAVSRDHLLEQMDLGKEMSGKTPRERKTSTNLVDVYVRHLRSQLDRRYRMPLIESVRGVGYLIR
ncbi:MAG: winged-helix domain-containing protein [Clostridia bacterium]|nr:winged-helix domain-containing protein [Clostridia bacterium]